MLLSLVLVGAARGAEQRDHPATPSEAKPHASCHNEALSEIPSPDAKLRAVIAHAVCKDKHDEKAYPWSYIYIIEPRQDINNGSPLYLIGFPSNHESRGPRQHVPLHIEWYSASGLMISYPVGTVVREVPFNDPALKMLFWHGVVTLTQADEKLGDFRTGKPPQKSSRATNH